MRTAGPVRRAAHGRAPRRAAEPRPARPDSMNARMSFFVTRRRALCPGTPPRSTPCSAAILATTGETKVFPLPELSATHLDGAGIRRRRRGAGCAGAGSGSGEGGVTGAGGGLGACVTGSDAARGSGAEAVADGAAGAGSGVGVSGGLSGSAGAAPAGPITASTVPTSTVSPS